MAGVRRSVEGSGGVPEQWYAAPAFYFTNPHAIHGPHDDIPVPPGSAVLDFELEVAAVIGREGRDLTPPSRPGHTIAGYTVLNDWSARDLQSAEMRVGLGPCKGKDTATTLGPYLVTADELEPYRDAGFLRLALTAEVNGEVVGRDLLSHMSWTFEEMVAYASRGTRVLPGDVLGSGTCGNGGCLAELWGLRGEQTLPPLQASVTPSPSRWRGSAACPTPSCRARTRYRCPQADAGPGSGRERVPGWRLPGPSTSPPLPPLRRPRGRLPR